MIFFLFFSKNPNRQFFDFGIFRKRFFESSCSKIEFPFQLWRKCGFKEGHSQNASPNLATVSSSFGPYFGNVPTLGLCYTKATSFPRVGWCIKVFAQMKSNDNLKGQRLSAYVTKKWHKIKQFVLLAYNPDEENLQTHNLQANCTASHMLDTQTHSCPLPVHKLGNFWMHAKQAIVEHMGLQNGRAQMDKRPFKAANGHAILLVGRARGTRTDLEFTRVMD